MRCLLLVLMAISACQSGTESKAADVPATRIVVLAPHLAELVYAAGAGERLVGVSAYSDFPEAVSTLPVVSDAFTVDQEQLLLLQPDLLLAWKSGTPAHVVDELRTAGYRVDVIETRGLEDIAKAIETIGRLTGKDAVAHEKSTWFRESIATLQQRYTGRERLRVFYQVSQRPLYTINAEHYIGEILELCGGDNVFADVEELAPAVTVEAVVDRDPEVLLAGSADGSLPFDEWSRWPSLAANRHGNRFVVGADEVGRPTPRVLIAAETICEHLDAARIRRAESR